MSGLPWFSVFMFGMCAGMTLSIALDIWVTPTQAYLDARPVKAASQYVELGALKARR